MPVCGWLALIVTSPDRRNDVSLIFWKFCLFVKRVGTKAPCSSSRALIFRRGKEIGRVTGPDRRETTNARVTAATPLLRPRRTALDAPSLFPSCRIRRSVGKSAERHRALYNLPVDSPSIARPQRSICYAAGYDAVISSNLDHISKTSWTALTTIVFDVCVCVCVLVSSIKPSERGRGLSVKATWRLQWLDEGK